MELDTVLEAPETIESWIEIQRKNGVEATLVKEFGPAGGNPVFLYKGTIQALTGLLVATFELDAMETVGELR